MNNDNVQPQKLSRRTFLRATQLSVTGALLAACGPPRGGEGLGQQVKITPQIILPSPVPAEQAATPTESPLLANFLALSELLTGVTNLNPTLGRVYLESLQTNDTKAVSVEHLLEQAGWGDNGAVTVPKTLDELTERGIFTNDATRQLADTITSMWYMGTYRNNAGETIVATYVDALAWQTLQFTKPKTICGEPGFWAQGVEPAG